MICSRVCCAIAARSVAPRLSTGGGLRVIRLRLIYWSEKRAGATTPHLDSAPDVAGLCQRAACVAGGVSDTVEARGPAANASEGLRALSENKKDPSFSAGACHLALPTVAPPPHNGRNHPATRPSRKAWRATAPY